MCISTPTLEELQALAAAKRAESEFAAKALNEAIAREQAKVEPYVHQEVYDLISGWASMSTWWKRWGVAMTALRAYQKTEGMAPDTVLTLCTERTMPGRAGKSIGTRVDLKSPPKGKRFPLVLSLSDGAPTMVISLSAEGPVGLEELTVPLHLIA